MERDCQDNVEVDSMQASEIHRFENMGSCEKGNFVEFMPCSGPNILVQPEGNVNHMEHNSVRIDGQLAADTNIDEEHFDSSLTISEPKKVMKQTESSKRRTKFRNQTESSGRQFISNDVSNFQSKPGTRASRRANAKQQEETSIKRTQHHKSFTIQQVQAQECTSQPTKNPKPSTEMKKAQRSNSSTDRLSRSASRATPNQGNPPSENFSPTIMKSKAHKNSVGQQGKAPQIPERSAKNPSTKVQKSRVRVNSSFELSSMDNKTNHFKKDSSSQKVWRVKTKKQHPNSESRNLTPPDSPERSRNPSPTSPTYYISCDGSVKTSESVTEKCVICERDFYSPFKDWEVHECYNEHKDEIQPAFLLPDIAVLACGHVFHSECLDSFVPEDQSSDPSCFVCLSSYG